MPDGQRGHLGATTLTQTAPLSGLPEDEEMLYRQAVIDAFEPEACRFHLPLHLRFRHLVIRENVHLRILGPVFEKHQLATGLQRSGQRAQQPSGFENSW